MVLATLLLVQAIDIAPMVSVIRAQTAEADRHRLYVRTLDPRWQPLIAAARDVTFEPADPMLDRQLFEEGAWRATSIGKPLRVSTTSRIDTRTAARLAEEHARFVAGDLDPQRLYILLPGATPPASASRRIAALDGVSMIIPEAAPQMKPVH